MDEMFLGAKSFNQDLSGWCVINIASKPYGFDDGADSWVLPRPDWGSCPGGTSIKPKKRFWKNHTLTQEVRRKTT